MLYLVRDLKKFLKNWVKVVYGGLNYYGKGIWNYGEYEEHFFELPIKLLYSQEERNILLDKTKEDDKEKAQN